LVIFFTGFDFAVLDYILCGGIISHLNLISCILYMYCNTHGLNYCAMFLYAVSRGCSVYFQLYCYNRLVRILLQMLRRDYNDDFLLRIGIFLLNSLACQVEGEHKQILGQTGVVEVCTLRCYNCYITYSNDKFKSIMTYVYHKMLTYVYDKM
jgi:hypothetical protein